MCPKLPTPVHGQIIQPDLSYGANATITCDEGYIYSNPNQSVRWCVGSGIWSGGNGTCEGKCHVYVNDRLETPYRLISKLWYVLQHCRQNF